MGDEWGDEAREPLWPGEIGVEAEPARPGKDESSRVPSSPFAERRAERMSVERRVRRRERDVSSCSCAELCAVCNDWSSCV